MCKVSNKLKLCTCTKPLENLKHYWIFHRFIKGKNEFVIGEPIMPEYFLFTNHPDNESIIEELLNNKNLFDVDIIPKNNDRLELSLTCKDPIVRLMTFGFEYKSSKWKTIEYDCFGWMQKHEDVKHGKITNALERIIENNK